MQPSFLVPTRNLKRKHRYNQPSPSQSSQRSPFFQKMNQVPADVWEKHILRDLNCLKDLVAFRLSCKFGYQIGSKPDVVDDIVLHGNKPKQITQRIKEIIRSASESEIDTNTTITADITTDRNEEELNQRLAKFIKQLDPTSKYDLLVKSCQVGQTNTRLVKLIIESPDPDSKLDFSNPKSIYLLGYLIPTLAFSALILGNLRLYLLSICKYAVLSAMLIVRSSNVLPRSLSDCKFAEVHQLSSGNDYLLSRKRILASTSLALNTRGT